MRRKILTIAIVAVFAAAGMTGAFATTEANALGLLDDKGPADKDKGPQPLEYTSVYYHTDKVVGTEVVNDDWWSGHDTEGTHYDSSTMKLSPDGQTLHDVLEFFGPDVLKRYYFKPFVLTKVEGDETNGPEPSIIIILGDEDKGSLYRSRGELINYEFKEEFGGAKRRAVVSTWLKLDDDNQFQWMIKRVDYYTRGEGKPEYLHSLVYTVWNDELDKDWNVEGDWVVKAHTNLHDMTVSEQTGNSFVGSGDYQDGPQKWSIENGLVDGNSIEMDWVYENSDYEAYFEGTIASDGTMSGTFDDTSGNQDLPWETIEGRAKGPFVPEKLESVIEAGPANLGGQRP